LSPHAEKAFARIKDLKIKRQIRDRIDALATNPRPAGVETLKGTEEVVYRLRSGDYRILYEIQDAILLVLVLALGPRADIYRRIPISNKSPQFQPKKK